MIHNCAEIERNLHSEFQSSKYFRRLGYGSAIDGLIERIAPGFWTVSNDEYESLVLYCPYCGSNLRVEERANERDENSRD